MEHDFKAFPELTDAQMNEFYFDSPHQQIFNSFRADVTKVHDGDTVTVRCDFRDFEFPIRFANIDTKELSEGGVSAGDYMRGQVEGKSIDVIVDPTNRVGRYGRIIGTIMLDGIDMNQDMINRGLAKPFDQRDEGKLPTLSEEFSIEQWL